MAVKPSAGELIYERNEYIRLMANKRKPPHQRGRFVVIKQVNEVALLTLANQAIVKVDGLVLAQDFHHVSSDIVATLRGMTANEGPVDYGIAQAELTVAQIAEALDASPTSENDVTAIERTRRRVRMMGTFERSPDEDQTTNNGRFKRQKLFLRIPAGQEMPAMWVRNRSGAALTTGGLAEFQQKNYGHWK